MWSRGESNPGLYSFTNNFNEHWAERGIQTPDQFITNEPLWSTELLRQIAWNLHANSARPRNTKILKIQLWTGFNPINFTNLFPA